MESWEMRLDDGYKDNTFLEDQSFLVLGFS